ncbi:hypothetical protein ACFFQF_11905 [Haladaptatus pallidirubidus]|uniref:hypothetical protein n=1 Tax=Haladaptatus pallidirubidus TaxID=1008152 RepID=UPI0035EC462F
MTEHPFLACVFFLLVYLVRPFFAWPTTAVAAAVGYVYGPVVGIPVALVGATMSSCVPFAGARYFGIEGECSADSASPAADFSRRPVTCAG